MISLPVQLGMARAEAERQLREAGIAFAFEDLGGDELSPMQLITVESDGYRHVITIDSTFDAIDQIRATTEVATLEDGITRVREQVEQLGPAVSAVLMIRADVRSEAMSWVWDDHREAWLGRGAGREAWGFGLTRARHVVPSRSARLTLDEARGLVARVRALLGATPPAEAALHHWRLESAERFVAAVAATSPTTRIAADALEELEIR